MTTRIGQQSFVEYARPSMQARQLGGPMGLYQQLTQFMQLFRLLQSFMNSGGMQPPLFGGGNPGGAGVGTMALGEGGGNVGGAGGGLGTLALGEGGGSVGGVGGGLGTTALGEAGGNLGGVGTMAVGEGGGNVGGAGGGLGTMALGEGGGTFF